MEKTCSKCKLIQPLKEFTKDSTKKDGYYPSCKSCYRKRVNKTGRRVLNEWHIGSDGYVHKGDFRQHRYVMEQHLGRKLRPNEHVHHINHDKTDNRIENLMVLDEKEHHKIHPGRDLSPSGIIKTCTQCGKEKYYCRSTVKLVSKKQYRCMDCYLSTHIKRGPQKSRAAA